ncbi:MAG: 2-iminoacetate synthase ThiH [Candidatus Eremiobacter antarcticus]|nr:2-iminoacetate synthase ThiH [Candidatus Eremiobacteraeota bacterium]MBC5808549.1 2-iminoacetate synthase ThiH [Candidatus Eremiobacteraeota bacterium]PZR62887.1 MAG: 2-iminoacetate synthase ThiH [Candidatus Eremiobacter sp. RRmetagenome_bin22]
MAFSDVFDTSLIHDAVERSVYARTGDVRDALAVGVQTLEAAAALCSPAAGAMLEEMAQRAHASTVERFGNTVALYAPLYLSNHCVCTCTYCGFSMGLDIKRKTLRIDEVIREARTLGQRGFRNILLVSAEHPKHVNAEYLAQCVAETKRIAQYVGLEVAAAETEDYRKYVAAGCDGVVLYQETYDPAIYAQHHLGGPKKSYRPRLDALERAARAGVRHLGIGALLGLADWRFEALALFAHARYLEKQCWRSQINISFPRINPSAGDFAPAQPVGDAQLVQLMCLFRIAFPTAGIVLSTREPAALRDALLPVGVTHMSAGSSTEPGGYAAPGNAGEQFQLEDKRDVDAMSQRVRELGYEPVFKDWAEMRSAPYPVAAP